MSIIGMDLGSSVTKIIEMQNGNLKSKGLFHEKDASKALELFLTNSSIVKEEIENIVVTGIGMEKVGKELGKIPVIKIDEFTSIGVGGLEASQKEEALIVSIGTGTAFVKASKDGFTHMGGTGIGGGTIFQMCHHFCDTNSFYDILDLSQKGDLEQVDLRIKDLTEAEIGALFPEVTACNFGKLSQEARKQDIAAGIVNMVFETIGVMAAFAVRKEQVKDIVLIGNVLELPQAKKVFSMIERLHPGIQFIIPEYAQYAASIGAVKQATSDFAELCR